eukprot:1161053-Pelagomonas_calceolata.AAC.4
MAPEGLQQHFPKCGRDVFDKDSAAEGRSLHASLDMHEQCAACAHFTPLEIGGRVGLIAPARICEMYRNKY